MPAAVCRSCVRSAGGNRLACIIYLSQTTVSLLSGKVVFGCAVCPALISTRVNSTKVFPAVRRPAPRIAWLVPKL